MATTIALDVLESRDLARHADEILLAAPLDVAGADVRVVRGQSAAQFTETQVVARELSGQGVTWNCLT